MLVDLITAFVVGFFAIGIHEAGHVIAGRLAGLHYWWLQTGPVTITRNRSGAFLRLQPWSIAWFGMSATFQPGLDCDRAVSVYRAVYARVAGRWFLGRI